MFARLYFATKEKKMNRKGLFLGLILFTSAVLNAAIISPSLDKFPDEDASTILENNSFKEITTRYSSVITFFVPEEATRLGFSLGNNAVNDRSSQTDAQFLQVFRSILDSLEQIDTKKLSHEKQIEYELMKDTLVSKIWQLEQNRASFDPLYYTQALDSVYDLMLLPSKSDDRKQRTDLLGRVNALPKVIKQAKENLKNVSPLLARLAMEKAYFAYLSFDEVATRITEGEALSNDARDSVETEQVIARAKASIREMFDFFKSISQAESTANNDWRMGNKNYARQLKDTYQIAAAPAEVGAELETRFEQAQHDLFDALQPFELSAEDDSVVLVDGTNQMPQIQPVAASKKGKGTPAKPVYVAPTANQFYGVAKQLQTPYQEDTLLSSISNEAAGLMADWVRKDVLPQSLTLSIEPLTSYFSYLNEYLFNPAYATFLLRLPTGNQLAKDEIMQRQFNGPATKLLISQEIVPGHYYQTLLPTSRVRRLLGSPTLANGWKFYSLQVAEEQGYIITDEERLFAAWQRFVYTLAALMDYRLHNRDFTYDQAFTFLTQVTGLGDEEAAKMIYAIAQNPAQAVSYVWGNKLWTEAAAPYVKKFNNPQKVTDLLLQVGNVSPRTLSKELKFLVKQKK